MENKPQYYLDWFVQIMAVDSNFSKINSMNQRELQELLENEGQGFVWTGRFENSILYTLCFDQNSVTWLITRFDVFEPNLPVRLYPTPDLR